MTAWFTTDRGDGSFDYNCDGEETWQNMLVCVNTEHCTVGGWACSDYGGDYRGPPFWGCRPEDLPDCGETGRLVTRTEDDDMGELAMVWTVDTVQGCN